MPTRSQRHLREIQGVDSGGNYNSLVEGYYWLHPTTGATTDVEDDITLSHGVASEIHAVGGASETTPTTVGGWDEPDDIYRQLSGKGIVELCRTDNLGGTVIYSVHIEAPAGIAFLNAECVLSLATNLQISSFLFDLTAGFRKVTTVGMVDTPINLQHLYDTGYWYPVADGGDGSGNKTGTPLRYQIGLAVSRIGGVGDWADLYIDGNIVRSDYLATALSGYKPDASRGITMWANVPVPLNDGSALNEAGANLMNRSSVEHKTHSLLIKRYGTEDRTDNIATIMRDHYLNRETISASMT